MNSNLFPWQANSWQQILSMRERMPHAILLYGMEGIGKTLFAEHLAKSLLCESPSNQGHACEACLSCNWVSQYSHPDYRRIRPGLLDEEDELNSEVGEGAGEGELEKKSAKASKAPSKEILIEQVRAIAQFMNMSTHRSGTRVLLLYPAEALNMHAANALLKSLEEPNPNTVFILVSHRLDRLLPTILSRCHKIALSVPTSEQAYAWLVQQGLPDAQAWLAQQGGAPLLALAAAQSEDAQDLEAFLQAIGQPSTEMSLKLAEKMHKLELPKIVACLQRWLYDIFSYKQCQKIRYYPKYTAEIRHLAGRASNEELMRLQKNVLDRQAIAAHPLSARLFLEDMLLEYSSAFK